MNGWEVDGKNLPSLDQDLVEKLAQDYPLCAYDKAHNRLFIIRKYSKETLQAANDSEPFVYGLACFFDDSSVTYNLPICDFTKLTLVNLPNVYYLPHLFFEIKNLPNIRTLPIDIAIMMDILNHQDEKTKTTQFLALNQQTIYHTEKLIQQKSIESSIVGELQQDKEFTDWWHSKEIVFSALNDQKLPVTFWSFNPEVDSNFVHHADAVLSHFLTMTHEESIAKYTHTMHQFCVASVGKSLQRKTRILKRESTEFYEKFLQVPEKDIWTQLAFTEIGVARRSDGKIYLFLMINPEWSWDRNIEMIFEENGEFLTIRIR